MIDWPNVIAGFLLGLTPLVVTYGLRAIIWSRNPLRKKYRGKFWVYHWSLVDVNAIREKELTIKFSWVRAKPVVTMPPDPTTRLGYRGTILKGQGSVIYLLLTGAGHKENILFVFNDPLYPIFEITTGVFASVDIKTKPVSSRAILANKHISSEDAKNLLKGRNVLRAEPTLLENR